MTLQNTANRSLTAGESDKLKYLLLNFFFLHEFDGVKVYEVLVYHQEVVACDPFDDKEFDNDDTAQRRLEAAPTAITTTAITIILQVSHGGCYTDNELGDAIMTVLEGNSSDIVKELRLSQGYPFFSKVDAVRFGIVDEEFVDGLVPNVARGSSGENDVHGSGRKTGSKCRSLLLQFVDIECYIIHPSNSYVYVPFSCFRCNCRCSAHDESIFNSIAQLPKAQALSKEILREDGGIGERC